MTERGRFDSGGLTVNGVGVDTPKEVSATASSTNWYTIATRSTGRAFGEFLISDSSSGKHNVALIMASTAYGKNSVTVPFFIPLSRIYSLTVCVIFRYCHFDRVEILTVFISAAFIQRRLC